MAFHTPKLLKKTEEAIKTFLKDDIEHTLPLIQKLEEIAFQLWTENNSKFLFDDGLGFEDEEEEWFWDEEVFFDYRSKVVPDTPYTPYQEKVTYISDDDSNYSSYVESSAHSTLSSPSSSTGYLGSCDSNLTASTFYTRSLNNVDDWIVISAELFCQEDRDWLLLSGRTSEEELSLAGSFKSSDCEKISEWTILSVHRKRNCDSGSEITANRVNTSTSSIRRQLFGSSDSETANHLSDSVSSPFTRTCNRNKDNLRHIDRPTKGAGDEKDEWLILTLKESPSGGRREKGQISYWNVLRFATIT